MRRAWRLIGRFIAFRPTVRGFESPPHMDLRQVLHSQLPVALQCETPTQYPCCIGSAFEYSSVLKMRYRNSLNEGVDERTICSSLHSYYSVVTLHKIIMVRYYYRYQLLYFDIIHT